MAAGRRCGIIRIPLAASGKERGIFPRLKFGAQTVEPARLEERSLRAAAGFAALGIAEGDVIAVMLRNEPAFLEALFAARALGAWLCPINWHFKADEAGFLLRDSGARVLVIQADLVTQVRAGLPADLPCISATSQLSRDALRGENGPAEAPPQWPRWDDWLASHAPHAGAPRRPRGIIPYTSGTTGRPKGVLRIPPEPADAARMAEAVRQVYIAVFNLDAESRALISAPLYHSAPASYVINAAQVGATLVLQPRFDALETLATIERERISHAYLVPTMYQRLLRLSDEQRRRYDLSSLRFVASTGSPCPPDLKRAMISWWGPVINEAYASSESGYVTCIGSAEWLAHPGSAGRPVGAARVRILGEDHRELPPGEVGTIYVRQPAYPDFTYINDAAARRAMDVDGLISVGDMGFVDAEGYLYISDRRSDMVISGGVNIYPAEIEAVLAAMPGVADCAVFGIPDEEFGEALAAAVMLREGAAVSAEQVRRWIGERMAGYKVPRVVDFHETLPREDTGKIFKRLLREPYWRNADRRI